MTTKEAKPQCNVAVILPTYNNQPTVAGVISEVLAVTGHVIIVDDGSTDGTADVLSGLSEITVVTHERNLGKGAALAAGFARAAEMGFTHAITMDTDGQHLASDIPRFIAAIEANPDALVVGVRDLSGSAARRKSRILRANSNFWVWVHTKKWIRDTQSGFRAYPLAPILELRLKTKRYDFEVEALVKAMWSGLQVVELPIDVRYDTESHSHFRPFQDFALVTHLNGCLFAQRLIMPASLRRVYYRKDFYRKPKRQVIQELIQGAVLQESGSPLAFAACIGIGVCFGVLPIWGFQMAAAIIVAHKLRLSKPLVVVASNISIPLMIPFVLYASLIAGRLVLTGHADWSLWHSGVTLITVWDYAIEYMVGAVILAVVAGLAAAVISYLFARAVLALRRRYRSCNQAPTAGGSSEPSRPSSS